MHTAMTAVPPCPPGIAPAEVRSTLATMLASEAFAKAQRMSRLLRFLVESRLSGAVVGLGEHHIGIAVFDRHPASYNTGEDPIVRVQMGRLRERLKNYYAAAGKDAELVISIPLGNYIPEIRRPAPRATRLAPRHSLALFPLACLTVRAEGAGFALGLTEQLAYQLFRAFGNQVISHTFVRPGNGEDTLARAGASHGLEGSLRDDGQRIRVAIRLVDAAAGNIAWSGQFDCCGPCSIAAQEQLSSAICEGLKLYFAHQADDTVTAGAA